VEPEEVLLLTLPVVFEHAAKTVQIASDVRVDRESVILPVTNGSTVSHKNTMQFFAQS
jgi:hypothetical protein